MKVIRNNANNKRISLQIDSLLVYIVYIKESDTHCFLFAAKNVPFSADTRVIFVRRTNEHKSTET